MADSLSVIAGITGITVTGGQLADAIYRICEKFYHGPQEMRRVATGIVHLFTILEDVAKVLEYGKNESAYQPRVLKDTESILERFESVQADVRKIVEGAYGFRGKVRWSSQRRKLQGCWTSWRL